MNKKIYIEPSVKLIDSTAKYIGFFLWMKSRQAIVTDMNGYHFMNEAIVSDSWFDNLPDKFIVGNEVLNKFEYRSRVDLMDLQYNNSEFMIFEINGSCLFRDLLYNVNKLAQWAESNRFLFAILDENARFESENYRISKEYEGIPEWENQFDTYMDSIKNDPIVDHNRREMPYSIMSRFWIGVNRASLISILSFLKYHAPFFYEVYGSQFTEITNLTEERLYKKLSPSIDQYIRGSDDETEGVTNVGRMTTVNSKMALILYSQFIRQTDTNISGLFDILMHDDIDEFKSKVFKGSTTFMITYTAHESKVKQTMSNRLCAFAMSSGSEPDSWNYFLDRFLPDELTPSILAENLPCKFLKNNKGNPTKMVHCKFHDDIKFRNEGKEISNCPCPLVTLSMKDAEDKKERDNNKIGDAFYSLTESLRSGGLNSTFNFSAWTSELIIKTETPLSLVLMDSIMKALQEMEGSKGLYSKLDNVTQNFLSDYKQYGLGDDVTCMMKGLALDLIRSVLEGEGIESYLISFGGDIYGRNTSALVSIENSDIDISIEGNFSVFTSGNDERRGNHIVGGLEGHRAIVVAKWEDELTEPFLGNTVIDILATKSSAFEWGVVNELRENKTHLMAKEITIINLDNENRIHNKTYCASPFFDENQIKTRDDMVSKFLNAFRPDLTESSKMYDKNHNHFVYAVVQDNVRGIIESEFLTFPTLTDDLGTLFEVGLAIANGIPIFRYDSNRWTLISLPKVMNVLPEGDIIFDCSTKEGAIALGYASHFIPKERIYYQLKGNRDNIMLSVHYTHIESDGNGNYEIIKRNEDDRDK